ncbi:hypothetical protein DFH09DRAFT_1308310 [Mycena vulgaris]|nr:hypothetical protein DFH09DRAFT_1308310 [Mycena vulgaris]
MTGALLSQAESLLATTARTRTSFVGDCQLSTITPDAQQALPYKASASTPLLSAFPRSPATRSLLNEPHYDAIGVSSASTSSGTKPPSKTHYADAASSYIQGHTRGVRVQRRRRSSPLSSALDSSSGKRICSTTSTASLRDTSTVSSPYRHGCGSGPNYRFRTPERGGERRCLFFLSFFAFHFSLPFFPSFPCSVLLTPPLPSLPSLLPSRVLSLCEPVADAGLSSWWSYLRASVRASLVRASCPPRVRCVGGVARGAGVRWQCSVKVRKTDVAKSAETNVE